MPGAFCPKTELFHPLDELALGVPCRGLGLLLFEVHALDRKFLPGLERGQQYLFCFAEGVDSVPSGNNQLSSGRSIFLTARIEKDLQGLPFGIGREGRKEPAKHQLVDFEGIVADRLAGCGSGWVDRRVIGR